MQVRLLARFIITLSLLIAIGQSTSVLSARVPLSNTAGTTERVSVSTDGTQGNELSWWSSISADGRYVAFHSVASNLVAGDTNGVQDVFVHDRQTGETSRVSVASDGTQGNYASGFPHISADGRYTAFRSYASNLVEGDTNGFEDIFVYDRVTRLTSRVSVATDGTQADNWSDQPSISADGRYVAFQSWASNLVDGDTNGYEDIFVHDRETGETIRVSVASDGMQGNQWSDQASISPDGLYIAFRSYASNLVQGDSNNVCDTDQDGVYDDNCQDIFLHQRLTGETRRVSLASDGTQGNNWSGWPSVSANGRFVAFKSWASNLVEGDTNAWSDIFVHDRETGVTTRISVNNNAIQGNNYSDFPSITADGRYVAFESCASNLINGDTNGRFDIFVRDRLVQKTTRESISSDGTQADYDSIVASIATDGRYLAFDSYATNLVVGDTNGYVDIFVRDRGELANFYLPLINH